jgi:hypothetical protein
MMLLWALRDALISCIGQFFSKQLNTFNMSPHTAHYFCVVSIKRTLIIYCCSFLLCHNTYIIEHIWCKREKEKGIVDKKRHPMLEKLIKGYLFLFPQSNAATKSSRLSGRSALFLTMVTFPVSAVNS